MEYAKLQWHDSGEPLSGEFGDVYFSKNNGLRETEYVFLQANRLQERFQNLSQNAHFVIAETGFGTGLNFLATLGLWQMYAPISAKLSFVSCEKYPLKYQDLQRVLLVWRELEEQVNQLLGVYPKQFYIGQTLLTISENVQLILLIDDAARSLAKIDLTVDAWFLDGFAPAKNPQMWSDKLFQEIYRLSHGQTTLATFTAAGLVKRGLEAHGFSVQKQKGFGVKREMITASIKVRDKKSQRRLKPYFAKPNHSVDKSDPIAVIGAGMAGCAMVYELSQRGVSVHLYEECEDIAQKASGNPYGILRPYITADANTSDLFHTQGFLYAREYILSHQREIDFMDCGALEILADDKLQRRFDHILSKRNLDKNLLQLVSEHKASEIAGCQIDFPCVYYPQALMVNPYSLCKSLLKQNDKIQIFLLHHLLTCTKMDQLWRLSFDNGKQLEYQTVIFAGNATLIRKLKPLKHLEIYPSYGQITVIKTIVKNRTILLDKGYLLPDKNGTQVIGATFRANDDVIGDIRTEDDKANIQQISNIIHSKQNIESVFSRVGVRCVTSDHLPMIGSIAATQSFHEQYYDKLQKGAILKVLPEIDYLNGLYVLTGFGSKGLCSMFHGAKILSALVVDNCNAAIANHVLEAVHPLRFQVRKYKQIPLVRVTPSQQMNWMPRLQNFWMSIIKAASANNSPKRVGVSNQCHTHTHTSAVIASNQSAKNRLIGCLLNVLETDDFKRLELILSSHFASIPNDWYRNNHIDEYEGSSQGNEKYCSSLSDARSTERRAGIRVSQDALGEGFSASIVYSFLTALGYDTIPEDVTNHGKIDLTIIMHDKIVIIEFKLAKLGDAKSAIQQIKDKKYAEKYLSINKAIYLIGMSFDPIERNVIDLVSECFRG
ncbi:bifunctional tRNA (5-methylaminomethyl-2-thiouridine)(34)-methyltransferase MnmD/FAD-dependent 5-carboxymethylaminomethyl-2-thiouridine(34) oxidoreductase MnmC [Caedibacter taeniospiralis]|uniref:bifunctional tRNA (5-methylaminomethyl-2-thiouridine)(34)-methyltransferase MnmD/FAD-dependent 5-carboxymethylaminomethyl-2-thiouridine(34) oxidoreductase MnmC n=1 Tax=Caedibacter taeniospiralis TaxID=28907 RepID=UPI0037C09271